MNSYSYVIDQLMASNQNPERPRTVARAFVSVTVTGPDQASLTMTTFFDFVSSDTFVPYDELTEEMVRSWIDAQTTRWDELHTQLDELLENQRSSSVLENPPLPWAPVGEAAVADSGTISPTNPPLAYMSEIQLRALIYEVVQQAQAEKV